MINLPNEFSNIKLETFLIAKEASFFHCKKRPLLKKNTVMTKGQTEVPVDFVDVSNLLSTQTDGTGFKIVKFKRKIK